MMRLEEITEPKAPYIVTYDLHVDKKNTRHADMEKCLKSIDSNMCRLSRSSYLLNTVGPASAVMEKIEGCFTFKKDDKITISLRMPHSLHREYTSPDDHDPGCF